MLIYQVAEAFKRNKVRFAIVGGVAVALYGAVRGTVDLDIIIHLTLADFEQASKILTTLGLQSRLPVSAQEVFNFREEYIRNRNLTAWSFYNPMNPADIVDIIITEDLENKKITLVRAGGRFLPLLSIEDLILMKLKSGRPQDLEDVKALETLAR
jgi:predicted nucleotidyltransferase